MNPRARSGAHKRSLPAVFPAAAHVFSASPACGGVPAYGKPHRAYTASFSLLSGAYYAAAGKMVQKHPGQYFMNLIGMAVNPVDFDT